MAKITPQEILDLCASKLLETDDPVQIMQIRMAARFAWEQKEMGGLEHVQFAYRNNTPIVPMGHCCHPIQLLKRGFIDGKGWPEREKTVRERVKLNKYFDGNHYYASLDGVDIIWKGESKWNTPEEAIRAAEEFDKDIKK